jgi:AcrR family transcriptional regulator
MPKIALGPRKQPKQARSRQMQEDILEAAIRVLAAGAGDFTTVRVAEVAGVSVGSLYQYYPNRAALLLALHEREVAAAWSQVAQLLAARERPPARRTPPY